MIIIRNSAITEYEKSVTGLPEETTKILRDRFSKSMKEYSESIRELELHIHQLRTGQLSESFKDREKYKKMDEGDEEEKDNIDDNKLRPHYSLIGKGLAVTPLWESFIKRNQDFRRHRFEVPLEQLKSIIIDIFNSKYLEEAEENHKVYELEATKRII